MVVSRHDYSAVMETSCAGDEERAITCSGPLSSSLPSESERRLLARLCTFFVKGEASHAGNSDSREVTSGQTLDN
jgi:hypothetical protein